MHGTDNPSPGKPVNGPGAAMVGSSSRQAIGRFWGLASWSSGACGLSSLRQKSLFTPAVINVCTRRKDGLGDEKLKPLKRVLRCLGDEKWGKLVEGLYNVRQEYEVRRGLRCQRFQYCQTHFNDFFTRPHLSLTLDSQMAFDNVYSS